MYIHFMNEEGLWLVGKYDNGNWIEKSRHKSRMVANRITVILNSNKNDLPFLSSPTLHDMIDHVETMKFDLVHKGGTTKLLNTLRYLSNFCLYTEDITKEIFLGVRGSGKMNWWLFTQVYSKFKESAMRSGYKFEEASETSFESTIWRQVL